MQFLVYSDHNPLFLSGTIVVTSCIITSGLVPTLLGSEHLSTDARVFLQEPEIKNLSSLPISITSYEVIFESLGGNTFGDYSADKLKFKIKIQKIRYIFDINIFRAFWHNQP